MKTAELHDLKALSVYSKCLRRGKKELAEKILKKHERCFPKSDMAIAFGMSLQAAKL